MKKLLLLIFPLLALVMFVGCDMTESDTSTDAESAIMKVITADESFKLEGLEAVENEDFELYDLSVEAHQNMELFRRVVRDSNYVWSFSRRSMAHEQEIIVEVEDDTSAQALVTAHVTGIFHVRQFERIWTGDDTWERGDSVRFSEKPIDMNTSQRVLFRKRIDRRGGEHWIPVAKTFQIGNAGSTLDIEALVFAGDDTSIVITDFAEELYGRRNPLLIPAMENPTMSVLVSNDLADEAEMVSTRMNVNSRHGNRGARGQFLYVETLENGDKVYTRNLAPSQREYRGYKGAVEVIDMRTLFDHDYEVYSAATAGIYFKQQRGGRPGGPGNRP